MSQPANNFKNKVRNRIVSSPTDKKFSLDSWRKAWQSSVNNSETDQSLFLAGVVFSKVLEELRSEIKALYELCPFINSQELIKAYCGFANRDAYLLYKSLTSPKDLSAQRLSNNKMQNELSLEEIATNCVDGIDLAIRQWVGKRTTISSVNTTIEAFEFVNSEVMFSQIYSTYESYWRALLWGEYEFTVNEYGFEVREIESDLSLAYLNSSYRKNRLLATDFHFGLTKRHIDLLNKKNCLISTREGKKRVLICSPVEKLDHQLQTNHALFMYQVVQLEDHLPKIFLTSIDNKYGFSVIELIEVFRLFVLLAKDSYKYFPSNDEINNIKKATKFSPSLKRNEVISKISKITGWNYEKSESLLVFLTFNGDKDKDLWSYPIIDLGENQITYLIAALVHPVLLRVVEHWLVKLECNLSDKGKPFENSIIEGLNSALNKNSFFSNHSPAVGKKFDLKKDGIEEIDLIFRFGNILVIGEIKSIVTTDSPISLYRTNETLLGAATQARRKLKFVNDNTKIIFDKLNWEFDQDTKYQLVPLIITSSTCVGYTVDGVPVCDLRIITKYFESNLIPVISVSLKEHLAWFLIYESFEDAQSNFEKYLKNPPQILNTLDDYEPVTCHIPKVSENSFNIAFTRLSKIPFDVKKFQEKKFEFPMRFSENFEQIISEMDVII